MLFKISHSAKHKDSPPSAAPVTLHPQFEADDEAGARAKHSKWLDDTGYLLLEGVELLVELLSDEGFDPDVQQVLSLQNQIVDLKAQLVAAGDAPAQVVDLKAQLAKLGADSAEAAKQLSDALGKAQASVEALTSQVASKDQALSDLGASLAASSQTIADKDSQIATLSAQLEEALRPVVVNPPVVTPTPAPADPAASSTPAADGSTPAP